MRPQRLRGRMADIAHHRPIVQTVAGHDRHPLYTECMRQCVLGLMAAVQVPDHGVQLGDQDNACLGHRHAERSHINQPLLLKQFDIGAQDALCRTENMGETAPANRLMQIHAQQNAVPRPQLVSQFRHQTLT